jgi:hypothetical protein
MEYIPVIWIGDPMHGTDCTTAFAHLPDHGIKLPNDRHAVKDYFPVS